MRGQGSFEYMMSYGWAVLVIVVLAVVLWNLGVFNPQTITQSSGFSVLRPVAWNFIGGDMSTTNATIAISNVGGIDLVIGVNGTNENKTMRFRKPWAPNCGFISQEIAVRNDVGVPVDIIQDETNGVWKVSIPAGGQVVITGTLVGANASYQCGGPSGGAYFYQITYPFSVDQYNIQHTDSGTISGKYQ